MKYTTFLFSQIALFKAFEIGNVTAAWWQILLAYIICYAIEKTDGKKLGAKFSGWAYMIGVRKSMRKEKKDAEKIINEYKNEKNAG